MSEITIIKFIKNSDKIQQEHQQIINRAKINFINMSSNPLEEIGDDDGNKITITKSAKIVKEVLPKGSLRKSTPESGIDSVLPIPTIALTRYFPKNVTEPYKLIDRLFISKGDEGFMMVNLNVHTIMKPGYYHGEDLYDYSKYISIYQGFEVYSEYNPIFNEVGDEIDEDPFPIRHTMLNWIEILCVSPDSRGKNVGYQLLKTLEEYLLANFDNNNIVIGLDVVGTKKRFQNLSLRNYYSNLGFKFPQTGFHEHHSGAQLAYNIIKGELI